MYLRTTTSRPRKDGSRVRYVALAHNEWDPEAGQSRARVLYNFGREDQLDRDALTRLVASINRYLGIDDEPPSAASAGEDTTASAGSAEALGFVAARRLGGVWALDGLWDQLGIATTLRTLAAGRRFATDVERVIFALVANRALEPTSKLAATQWVTERAWIPGLPEVSDDACYRAMDWLLDVHEQLAEQTYWATADLLNLEVDLLFFDTTSTYFETDTADPGEGEASVGSAPTATPKTTGWICRRSSSGWPSPARGSRSGCGPGRATAATRR